MPTQKQMIEAIFKEVCGSEEDDAMMTKDAKDKRTMDKLRNPKVEVEIESESEDDD